MHFPGMCRKIDFCQSESVLQILGEEFHLNLFV